jgi:hypothetical protein
MSIPKLGPAPVTRRVFGHLIAALGAWSAAPTPSIAKVEHDIPLIETFVAGTRYYEAAAAIGSLQPGTPLVLRRQPQNPHDDLAIEVFAPNGFKLGYVPRSHNAALAALADAGKRLASEVTSVDSFEPDEWAPHIGIVVSLRD